VIVIERFDEEINLPNQVIVVVGIRIHFFSYDSDRVNDICSCPLMEDIGREATLMREQDSYESADHAHTSGNYG